MKKQLILAATGILLVGFLFIFGRTTEPKKKIVRVGFNAVEFINTAKQKLPQSQAQYLQALENNAKEDNTTPRQLKAYDDLANFWKDSARQFLPYAFWISKAAKLDNSEKNLTFAAQLFLDNLRGEHDVEKLKWEKSEAISLFEKAIELNPGSDDLRIGLGSCYVFGSGSNGDPNEVMKGIRELLTVVKKDSNNMRAQMVLGIGGYVSGQYDKGIARLKKVIDQQPNNIEAIAFLADTYAAKGDKEEAIKWYTLSKKMVNNPGYSKDVDERIKMLK